MNFKKFKSVTEKREVCVITMELFFDYFQVDLKVQVLQNHIKACPNLSRYVSKAIQRFFPSGKNY